MLKKFHKYSHPEFKVQIKRLQKAIDDKVYVFDLRKPFNIEVLDFTDEKIPRYLQNDNIFDYINNE